MSEHNPDARREEIEREIEEKKDKYVFVAEDGNAESVAETVAEQATGFSLRFQLLATLLIVVCALAGGGVGVVIANNGGDEEIVSWIGLPGDLFIRALKCVVLPLVFVNVILAVIQMFEAGKAGSVGKWTVLIYLLTTLIASVEGLIAVVIFQDQFSRETRPDQATFIGFLCENDAVVVQTDKQLYCVDPTESNSSQERFEVNNVNDFFVTDADEFDTFSFSQTLQNGIFKKLLPDNIVAEFADGGFVGVVMFGVIFGAASQYLKRKPALLIESLKEINEIMARIIQWIIYLTPIAVFSLIANALGQRTDLEETFMDIRVLLYSSLVAIVTHVFVVYPLIFLIFTRRNPYRYMRYIVPAQVFAFACASSAATLPVTLRCVTETGQVPDSVRDFVLPIGATINMDGTALYFPPALIFLARTSGLDVDPAAYFLIILVSTIGSAGAAPVPNAGLVLIITAFNTVFNSAGTPANFAIVVGIDWLMDRFQTALNITGDAMVSRIVTHLAGLNIKRDQPTSELVAEDVGGTI